MEFDSYVEWYDKVKTIGFEDIIFGVKDTIKPNTLYISVQESKVIKMDNTSFVIGYTYSLVMSVPRVDSLLLLGMGNLVQSGLGMAEWSEKSHLYVYTASVYLPVGKGGQPFQ